MNRELRLDLPPLLPDVTDAQDACVTRLQQLLTGKHGLDTVHIITETGRPPALCLHYDPELVPLAQVERLAKTAGMTVTDQFGHAVFALRAIDGEDAGRRIEQGLRAVKGVLDVSVNLAAQRARVEFARDVVTTDTIQAALQRMGYSDKAPTSEQHTDGDGHDHGAEASWFARNKELVWSLIAGALLLAAWLGELFLGLP